MRNERFNEFDEISRVLQKPDEDRVWNSSGPVLGMKDGVPYYHDKLFHVLYVGLTGAGKTHYGMKNHLGTVIKARESFVATDPKGELYRQTSGMLPDDYLVKVLDFRNVTESHGFNLLSYPYKLWKTGTAKNKQRANQIIDDMAMGLYPIVGSEEPFWKTMARTVFVAVVTLLFQQADSEDEVNLYNVYNIVSTGDAKSLGAASPLSVLLENEAESITKMSLKGYLDSPNDTRGSIRTVVLDGLASFVRSEALAEMLSNDDFHIESLDGTTPTAIYVIMPDETSIFASVVGSFISQITKHYISIAEDKYGGALPKRLNVMIDELASVGKSISNMCDLMATARSRNIRIAAVLQSYKQLNELYGDNKADTIVSNFNIVIAFTTNNWETLKELSNRCGERRTKQGYLEPLITASQIGALDVGQALVLINGRYKYITYLPGFHELFPHSLPPRNGVKSVTRKPVAIFDLKKKAANSKRKSMEQKMATRSLKRLAQNHEDPVIVHEPGMEPPFLPPLFREGELEQMLKDIDARIAELDDLELEEIRKHKYIVELMDGGRDRFELAQLTADCCGISTFDANTKILRTFPAKVYFKTKKEADSYCKKVQELGAVASVQKVDKDFFD